MTDYHTKTFYGQKSSISLTSPSKSVSYVFLSIFNRKEDGTWERTSEGEGKTVKITIEEIICILEVLHKNSANWTGFHVFKERKTEIYVGWEKESREVIQIKIGDYVKKLRFPNLNFLTMMLEHIIGEKIEFATSGITEKKSKDGDAHEEDEYSVFSEQILARDGLQVVETTEFGVSKEIIEIKAKIKVESPKALLITLESYKEFWIPKSTIHSKYDLENKKKLQTFIVDKWIIEKQRISK
ncbi:unnamed protein product [marine sediment metagenome]|uniref:Uncharacterized protein n=1 Tax=marine sediment metagenome TaxID=412755 RepID=X1HHB5_9ZZZZ